MNNRQLRRRLGREALKVQTPADAVTQKIAITPLEIILNGCPLFVGIPIRSDVKPKKRLEKCRNAIMMAVKRSQYPNVKDVYEMSIERITKMEPN